MPRAFLALVLTLVILAALAACEGEGKSAQVVEPTPTTEPSNSPRPEPTEYKRRLTGTEAAIRVQSEKNIEFALEPLPGPDGQRIIRSYNDCEAVDFNEFKRSWVVQCHLILNDPDTGESINTDILSTWLIDDLTSQIDGIGGTPGPLPE